MAKRVSITDIQIEKMKTQYTVHGLPLQKIALELGISVPTASRYLKLAGVEIKGKGRRRTKAPKVVEATVPDELMPYTGPLSLEPTEVEQAAAPETTPVFSFQNSALEALKNALSYGKSQGRAFCYTPPIMDGFEDFLNELGTGSKNKNLDFKVMTGTDIQLSSHIPFGIPTRIPQLDLSIGRAGYPVGRIVEIFGFEHVGKSCAALAAVASVQRMGGYAVWIDTERCWDPAWATLNGVDPSRVAVTSPKCIEAVFTVQDKSIQAYNKLSEKKPYIVVTDSVTGVPTYETLERGFEDGTRVGSDARAIRNGIKKLVADIADSNMLFIFINHSIAETNAKTAFAAQSTAAGGHALKFYASLRLQLSRFQTLKDEDDDGAKIYKGMKIQFSVKKNKIAKTAKTEFNCQLLENGFDIYENLFDAYIDVGLLTKVNMRSYLFEPSQTQITRREWKTFVEEHTTGIDKAYEFFLKKAQDLGMIKDYGINA